jgi:hypothetical protein
VADWNDVTARRRTLVRNANERIGTGAATRHPDEGRELFACECADPDCRGMVSLTHREYESARECPTRFVIVVDHEDPQVERLITETARFAIVETLPGRASRIARRSNPRATSWASGPAERYPANPGG